MMLSREAGQCTDFEQMSVRRIDRFGNMMKRLDTRIQSSSAWHPTSSQLPFSSCQPSTIHGVVLCVFRSWGRMSKIRAPLAPATFPHLLPTQPWVSSKDGAHGDKSWSTPVGILKPGSNLPPGKVTRYIDANPIDIQLDIPMLGQFRVYVVVPDLNDSAQAAFIRKFNATVSSGSSLISRASVAAQKSYIEKPRAKRNKDVYFRPERYTTVSQLITFSLISKYNLIKDFARRVASDYVPQLLPKRAILKSQTCLEFSLKVPGPFTWTMCQIWIHKASLAFRSGWEIWAAIRSLLLMSALMDM